jgi:hypothetical protein
MRGAGFASTGDNPFGSGLDGNDFTAIIMTAGAAQMVRALQLAAIRAFLKSLSFERIMAAPHVAL